MPMNRAHRRICSSDNWARMVGEWLPAMLADFELGDDVLEIGPGFGATTRVLVDLVPKLTALEVDEDSARRLSGQFAGKAEIVHGSGADMPFADGRFSAVVCFTMLHHVPSTALQDELFAEAGRVLRPGGVFAGADSQASLRFRLLHIGDTMTVVSPRTLPDRLATAGFTGTQVGTEGRRLRFAAYRPAAGVGQ
jgi:SAM-dependent methyltransferase